MFIDPIVIHMVRHKKPDCACSIKNITSSVYDCTVEDVEYIYNTLSLLLLLKMCILSLL